MLCMVSAYYTTIKREESLLQLNKAFFFQEHENYGAELVENKKGNAYEHGETCY